MSIIIAFDCGGYSASGGMRSSALVAMPCYPSSVTDWQLLLRRCLVFTKRLSRAKQALAQTFNQVSVASVTFQQWRKLASTSSHASAAARPLLGSLEDTKSLVATSEQDFTLHTDG